MFKTNHTLPVKFQRLQKLPLLVSGVLLASLWVGNVGVASARSSADTFQMVTYNTRFDTPANKTVGDIRQFIKSGADVIALQEMQNAGRTRAVLDAFACDTCAFSAYAPGTYGAGELMLLWRKSQFTSVTSGGVRASNAANVKGTTIRPLYVNYVELKFNAQGVNKSFIVLNNHFPSQIDKNGRPDPSEDARMKLYDKNMDAVKQKVKNTPKGTPVFVVGDFNVDYRKDKKVRAARFPTAAMASVGAYSNWAITDYDVEHKARYTFPEKKLLIDYVFMARNGTQSKINSTRTINKSMSSDHNAVSASISIY